MPEYSVCSIEGCTNPVCRSARRRGWCVKHYTRWKRHGDPNTVLHPAGPPPKNRFCGVAGCENKHYARGFCIKHYAAWQNNRTLDKKNRLGVTMARGYVMLRIPEHPNSSKQGYVYEHVKVMSEKLGRPLLDGESVHHLNGIKTDNRPENLELWSKYHPSGQRVEDLVAFAVEIIRAYGPEVRRLLDAGA